VVLRDTPIQKRPKKPQILPDHEFAASWLKPERQCRSKIVAYSSGKDIAMAESTPLQFDIPDMVSEDNVRSITAALRKIDARTLVHADLGTKRLMVGAQIDAGRAAEAIEAAGFSVKAAG
jgi:copper chaperone